MNKSPTSAIPTQAESEKNKNLVPRLRFPEFKNLNSWHQVELSELILSISSSLSLNKLELRAFGYPVYGADSIVGHIDDFQHDEAFISMVKDGAGVGRLRLCQRQSSILGTLVCLKSKNNHNYSLTWLYYLLNTIDFSLYVKGSGIPHIYYSDYKKKIASISGIKEQQKIADCLSSIDTLITAHTQKHQDLQTYKKGLMQNLFPQPQAMVSNSYQSARSAEEEVSEGVGLIPKLRFPEFKNLNSWHQVELSELILSISSSLSLNKLELRAFGYPVYGADSIVGHIDDFQHDEAFISMVKDGAGVGRLRLCQRQSSILGTLVCLKSKNNHNYSLTWLYYLLNTIDFSLYVKGSGIPHIYYSDYKKKIASISGIKEQQKIADCLSSIDTLITAQAEKIAQLKNHKQGLMQQLFPNTECITP